MNSPNPNDEKSPTPDTGRQSDAEPSNKEPNIPPAPSLPTLPPAKPHCEITSKTEKEWWNKCKPFVETIGIVLLAIYTGFTIEMYYANKEAADAAKSAADTAKASLHFDQRAWVSVVRDNFQWHVGEEMVFPARTVNNGKTPAKNIQEWITATWMKGEEKPEFTYEHGVGHLIVRGLTPLLWPSDPSPFKLPVYKKGTRTGEIMTLTQPMLIEMHDGKSYVLMHGKVSYDDVFGVNHWITFCDIYPSSGWLFSTLKDSYRACIEYNQLDTND